MYYTYLYTCASKRERERESEIEIWQPEGMKILDRIFPIPAIKIKVKEK